MANLVNENSEIEDVNTSSESEEDDGDEEILKIARERLVLAEEAESEIRRHALDDLNFRIGKQWPDNIQQDRERDGRPCLVINRLPQFVQQVTNDQRQNRPGIKVHPVSDGADQDTGKIIQGLIRHIEYNSNAEAAYDTAFEGAATNSFGYFRFVTQFSSPESFDQEIMIKRIRNPMSVFVDPFAQEPDGSDFQWAFIIDDLSKDEYKFQYPKSRLASISVADWSAIGNNQPDWIRGDSARVAEYFRIEMVEKRIHLLKTGEIVEDDQLQQRQAQAQAAGIDASLLRTRIAKVPVVHWVKMNGIEILEQTIFPGSYIPIIPVYGAEIFVNGKRVLESVIRNAKDAQRMYNYWKSAETETIALAPRTPIIAAEGQLEGYESMWASANRKNHAFLYYKPTTIAGQLAPPPARQTFEPATQAITQAAMLAADDLKATTGIYDSALGAQSKDVSGVAIQRRNNQTLTSNFHFTDNLTRSMKHAGRILVEIIPEVYDAARTVRIVGEDGTQKLVRINESFTEEGTGKDKIYNLDVGQYDVTVDTGPSFASKRQEAAQAMAEIARGYPALMQVAGDLMVKNMDWPGAQEISDRLKLALPPNLQQDPKQKQIPPMVQAQMQQMQQMIKGLTEHLNETTKIIETKQMEISSKERIEFAKIQADIEINMAKLGTQSSIALLEQEVGAINHRLKLIGINQPIDAQNNFVPIEANGGNYAGEGHVGSVLPAGQSPGQSVENP